MMPPDGRLARSVDVGLGCALALAAVWLRVEYVRHAGALWRDEIDSVNVAARATLGDVLAHQQLDSFPVAWVSALHGWIASGFGAGDASVRRFGGMIGVLTVGIVWWCGRRIAGRVPLVSLLLLGASASMVVYGSEVRGYGLATIAILCSLAATCTYVTQPGTGTFLVAGLAAVLATQTSYANPFLLVATAAAGAAVAILRREWLSIAGLTVIGLAAVASLGIEARAMASTARDTIIDQGDYPLAARIAMFRDSLAPGVRLLAWTWAAAALAGTAGWVVAWLRPMDREERERALFAAVTATASVACTCAYLLLLVRVSTQHWYYLTLMAVLATSFEVGIVALARRLPYGAFARAALVAGVALALAGGSGTAAMVRLRMTNVDAVAVTIAKDARPDDLVVVLPWYVGTTFGRYWRGTAPWIAFPDVHFTDTARPHGQVAERMTRGEDGVRPELERIETTLRAGGRVWIVGLPLLPPKDRPVEPLPPAPSGPEGWASGPYLEGWALRLGALLRTGVRDVWKIPPPDVGRVNEHENLPIVLLEGWR